MNKTIMTFLLAFVLAAPVARAQMGNEDGPREGGGRMEERIAKMFDQLNLSDAQKKLLEANRAKNKGAKRALMESIKTNMKAMGEELKKQDLDMARVNALHEESKQLFNKMADQRFHSILEVRKILTKEQFSAFAEMMEKHKGQRRMFKQKPSA